MLFVLALAAIAAIAVGVVKLMNVSKQSSGGGSFPFDAITSAGAGKSSSVATLSSVPGGYVKPAVLMKLDAYNGLVAALEEGGLDRASAEKRFEAVKAIPLERASGRQSGFSVPDVDIYIAGVEQKIENKLAEL